MPAISKIRLTNIVYEDGDKRFNDEVFLFNGHNGAILLENGGGKTVFIHTVLQAILPHTNLGDRKIKETLQLENAPAHIGIEWIINEHPRRYMTTAVSLFLYNNKLDSYRYVFEYEEGNHDALEAMPFAIQTADGTKRPAYKEEMAEYYSTMKSKTYNARTFDTILAFHKYIENQYQLITNEWESIVKINRDEGGIEKFFESCRTTTDLYDRLLIPTVEDSIAGHEQGMFADMFEKQREGFQTYRNLQKSMEEHQAIQTELEKYVGEFATFSEQQSAYEMAKQQAKGIAECIEADHIATEKKRSENEVAWEEWQATEFEYKVQEASYGILIEQEKFKTYEVDHLEALRAYEEQGERLQKSKNLYYSLQHANYQENLKAYKQSLAQSKAELEEHDRDGEVQDVEAELEIENAKLHGFFQNELEQFEKRVAQLELERRPIMEAIENISNKQTIIQSQLEDAKQVLHTTEGQASTKEEQREKIKQQILANPEQENVQAEYQKWSERHQWLDEEIIRLHQFKKTSEQQINVLEEELATKHAEMNEYNLKLNDKQRDEQTMQEAHDALLEQLASLRPSWKSYDNLHLKESSIYDPLIELQKKLTREREELMDKERLARRFVDDYDGQESFFSDPFLTARLTDWQNQFYIQTGTEFYANFTEEEKSRFAAYPLWPLTLITTETAKEKVIAKLTEIKDRLQYPIAILTLEEVKQIENDEVMEAWIAPTHWQTNLDRESFTTWKEQNQQTAAKLTKLREAKENEVEQCNTIIRAFEQFFQAYPTSYKEKLIEAIHAIQTKVEVVKREIIKTQSDLAEVRQAIQLATENEKEFNDEIKGVARQMEKAIEFFQVERELADLAIVHRETTGKVANYEKETRQLKREINSYENEKESIDEQIIENKNRIQITKADSLYQAVKAFRPNYTDEAKAVILDRRQTLQLKIHGMRQTYGTIDAKYRQAIIDIKRTEADIERIVRAHREIDREMEFPVDGTSLLERTWTEIETGEKETTILAKLETKANNAFVGQKSRVKLKIEQFHETFPQTGIFEFTIEITAIADHLEEEKQKLTERKAYLHAEKERITKELTNIEQAFRKLDRFEEAHHFKRTNVTAITLSEKERTEFTYERLKFVTTTIQSLQKTSKALVLAQEKIDRAKHHFRIFCRANITERKLREMATEGIEIKTTYEDILEFRQNMLTTLNSADQYAREYISKNDKEVQAFINSIHNHLINVTEQLRVIPKKTKVKVNEQWKEIFKFTIPEWTEEDGKSRIRTYMDWILEQLEASHFKNEQGLEDSGKVRKQIETWLHTKSLLQVVMENEVMKVSCRKVTNDNQVTSRLTSWEQSNQWSGGEKWSKNMTLFLGILNFVAEKKQHIATKMKRHRAVILDNPFGKASSDHVLSPVFFIAEQLGFQIIALTAHADGKFLQDYFPIIYSLKLRTTLDDSKQVMSKEKSLHHAYFEDHEPAEMKRLEEREQLELF